MYIKKIKNSIITASNQELKISIRNLILVTMLTALLIATAIWLVMPLIQDSITDTSNNTYKNKSLRAYFITAMPLGLLLAIIYPIRNIVDIITRRNIIKKFNNCMDSGASFELHEEYSKSLSWFTILGAHLKNYNIHYFVLISKSNTYTIPIETENVQELKRLMTGKSIIENKSLDSNSSESILEGKTAMNYSNKNSNLAQLFLLFLIIGFTIWSTSSVKIQLSNPNHVAMYIGVLIGTITLISMYIKTLQPINNKQKTS